MTGANLGVIMSSRHCVTVESPKRATVYFDPDVHKALQLRAAASDRSVSDMVNVAVRRALAEDAVEDVCHRPQALWPTIDSS